MALRRLVVVACLCAGLLHSRVAPADWLADQLQANGSYSTEDDLATSLQSTSEAVRALRILGRSSEVSTAEAYISAETYGGTEYVARQIVAAHQAGSSTTALVAELLTHQAQDGGFGELPGFSSNALDTAFALAALSSAGSLQTSQNLAAINYLLAAQAPDGRWSATTTDISSIYVTSQAVQALWPFRSLISGTVTALSHAKSFLLAQRAGTGLWSEDFGSASALIALAPLQANETELASTAAALLSRRDSNGSWNDDVFGTALAMRALYVVSQTNANPDLGSISARLVDGDTLAPLVGVVVGVTGPVPTLGATDEAGAFELRALTAGNYVLTMAASGYPTLTSNLTLRAGQQINLGTLRVLHSQNPTSARVQGQVLELGTATPVVGATVSVTGETTLQTDLQGKFVFSEVAPGQASLTVSKLGYHTVQSDVTLVGGATLDFSIAFRGVSTQGFDVVGVVTDSTTSSPLTGVAVAITGSATASTTTGATGVIAFDDLAPGTVQVSLSKSGYMPQLLVAQVESGQLLDVTSALDAIPPQAPQTFSVNGIVTNRTTGNPLAGVGIAVTGAATGSTITASDGSYQLTGLTPGQVTITASLSGYSSAIGETTALAYQSIEFSPSLLATSDAANGLRGIVVDASNGTPISVAAVQVLIGASTRNLTTDANGAFLTRNLPVGAALVTISATDFQPASLTVDIGSSTFIGIGQVRLLPEQFQAPVELEGVVVDSVTNALLAGVEVRVTRASGTQSQTTDQAGEFIIAADSGEVLDLEFVRSGYRTAAFTIQAQPEDAVLGQVRLRPETVDDLFADLAVRSVDRNLATSDPVSFAAAGSLGVEIQNRGTVVTGSGATVVAFADLDRDSVLDDTDTTLATQALNADVPIGATTTLTLTLSGTLPFRDAPIVVMVDADKTVFESNEANNIGSSASLCQAIPPPTSALDPVVKWHWTGSPALPTSRNVFGPPLVAQTSDDNNDGQINALDVPDVIFTIQGGALTVVSGDDGRTLWQTANGIATSLGSVAVGDIDGDGLVEIVSGNPSRTQLLAWENDGSLKWSVPHGPTHPESSRDAVAIADLNADGTPEIIVGRRAYSNTGALLWQGTNDHGGETSYGLNSIAVDLNDDGLLEVVAGRSAYTSTGALLWHQSGAIGDGFTAIGNLDGDASPEIVLISTGRVYVLEHTGTIKWGPVLLPLSGNRGGAPTVGDFDGDGQAEIGIAGQTRYTVLETDGSIKWSAVTVDVSSARTGSSLFDFDGDGRTEVVYADEQDLFIFDGATGAVIQQIENGSGTTLEYPVVADVDGDGRAELVVTSTSPGVQGVRAFEGGQAEWMPTRPIWNQHSYHVTNVNDDGTIPAVEAASWLGDNSYRQNASISAALEGAPDLTAGRLKLIDGGTGQPASLTVRVGNAGTAISAGIAIVAFYQGDPNSGGTLLGSATLGALGTGEHVDITLNNVAMITPSSTLYAVVDSTERFTECNEGNNSTSTQARPALGDLDVSTDAATYAPGDIVGIPVTVLNSGSFTSSYSIALEIRDNTGAVLATLSTLSANGLAAGADSELASQWNSGTTLAGTYQVFGTLSSAGVVLATASTNFAIAHAGGAEASLRLTPDRPVYSTSATVELNGFVRNLTTATIIEAAALQVVVRNPSNTIVSNHTLSLGDLAPGSTRQPTDTLTLSNVAEGTYTVQGTVLDGNGATVVSASTSFAVLEDLAATLAGSVSVSDSELDAGQPLVCTEIAQNTGTISLGSQDLRHTVVRLADGSVREQHVSTVSLAANGSNTDQRSVNTSGYLAGNYACALQARVDTTWHDLAYATFSITQPAVDISASLAVGPRGRLLALVDRVDGWTCAAIKNVELWSAFQSPLPQDAELYVELMDGWGQIVETETVALASYNGTVNAVTGNAVDLLITGLSDEIITVELRSTTTLPHALRVFAWISSGNDWIGVRDSGPMGDTCGWPYGEGVPFWEFETSRVDLPWGAPTPPTWAGAPSLATQQDFLESLLDANGWSYTIVDDVADFTDEMRSGQYSAYALFAEHATLPSDVQKEVREAVFRGEGLLDAAEHDDRHVDFDAALGLTWTGRRTTPTSVEFFNSDLHTAATVAFELDHGDEGDMLQMSLQGAQAVAKFVSAGTNDAVTQYAYGNGRSVFAGYDLLAEATEAGAQSTHAALILNALNHVQPVMTSPRVSQTVPLRFSLTNNAGANTTRVTLPVPLGVTVVDPGAATLTSGTLTWTFSLAMQEQRILDAWVRLPTSAGTVAFDGTVDYFSGSQYVNHRNPELDLVVASRPTLATARAAAIGLGNGDIVAWIDIAQQHLNNQEYPETVKCIFDVIEELIPISGTQARAVRDHLDDVLWQVGRLR